jgi:hypothetical protein
VQSEEVGVGAMGQKVSDPRLIDAAAIVVQALRDLPEELRGECLVLACLAWIHTNGELTTGALRAKRDREK